MEIIPAIDIRGGKAVRLFQGDYARETVFANDPVDMARHWASLGATRLHVVDLDGAREGRAVNTSIIAAICAALKIPVEVGGGLRTLDSVQAALDAGADRAILGTVAVKDPDLVREACRRLGGRIVVGVDARDGNVAVQGWLQTSVTPATHLMRAMEYVGVRRFIYTDISRDGTLEGPNIPGLQDVLRAVFVPVIASGGVSGIDDIRRLSTLGVEGVIVGQALYTGALKLEEALEAVR